MTARVPRLGWILLLCLGFALPARAGFLFLPRSRHQQFLSFAFLTEEQAGLLFRNERRAIGSIAGAITLWEYDGGIRPQLTFFGSVHVSFLEKSWLADFKTETFDARFGLAAEAPVSDEVRLSLGLVHTSGHAADSILDPDLVAPNMGDDSLHIRVLWDPGPNFRVGTTLRPLLNADPTALAFAADQFFEWFPWGDAGGPGDPHPYLAVGLDEGGVDKIRLNYHFQLGVFYGNHRGAESLPTVRLVAGYYHGADLRLKYARFRNNRVSFPYLGALFHL